MLSANVLQLTVITTTLSFNVLTWFYWLQNAKLSVYVLSLTVATATLSVNMLTLTVATAMLSVDINGCNVLTC